MWMKVSKNELKIPFPVKKKATDFLSFIKMSMALDVQGEISGGYTIGKASAYV